MRFIRFILCLWVTIGIASSAVNAERARSTPPAPRGTLLKVPREEHLTADEFWLRYSKRLGLDGRDTMVIANRGEIASGRSFQRYWQYHQGIRVIDGEFILHQVNGAVAYGTGHVIPGAQLPSVQPTVSSEQAIESAESHLAARLGERRENLEFVPAGTPSLVLIPWAIGAKRAVHRLAYRLKLGVAGKLSSQLIDVDAGTARVLRVESPIVEDTETVLATDLRSITVPSPSRRSETPQPASIGWRPIRSEPWTCRRPRIQ